MLEMAVDGGPWDAVCDDGFGGAEATAYGVPGLTAQSLIRAATRYVPIEGDLLLRG